jgi:hypothetical protein
MVAATPQRKHLSPAEFVAESGLSLATVHRYLKSGRLPKVQIGGFRCRVLIPREALKLVADALGIDDAGEVANVSSPSKTGPKSSNRRRKPRWLTQQTTNLEEDYAAKAKKRTGFHGALRMETPPA